MRPTLLALLLAALLPLSAQDRIAAVYLDPVGKPYFLLENANLVTDNPLGNTVYAFFDSSLGMPDLVDVTNPFEIILYYREYGQIILLDRTLSELGRIDLFAIDEITQPGPVARSFDNRIWVFDDWEYRLQKFDNTGRLLQQSNNLRLELDLEDAPDAILVDETRVALLYVEANRIALFRNTGRFLRWIDLPHTRNLGWNSPYLLAAAGPDSWWWHPDLPEVRPVTLPPDYPTQHPLLLRGNRLTGVDSTGTVLQEWSWQ